MEWNQNYNGNNYIPETRNLGIFLYKLFFFYFNNTWMSKLNIASLTMQRIKFQSDIDEQENCE